MVQEEAQKYRSKPEVGRSPVPVRNPGTLRSARPSVVSNPSSQASASPGKSPLGHRMYTEAMNKKLETDRLRAQLIQKKQLEELEGATFSPKVNTKASKGGAKHHSRTALKSSKKDDTKSVTSDGSGSALREEHLFDDDVPGGSNPETLSQQHPLRNSRSTTIHRGPDHVHQASGQQKGILIE